MRHKKKSGLYLTTPHINNIYKYSQSQPTHFQIVFINLEASFDPKLRSYQAMTQELETFHGLVMTPVRVKTICQINKHSLQVSWL